jgi:hypothetical protein
MRKRILVPAFALVAVLAIVGVAYAVNVYKVTPVKTTPAGAGTASKPQSKAVQFGFEAQDTSGGRATPIKRYTIIFQGLKSFAKYFPKCSFAAANDNARHHIRCGKARVGGGVLNALAGSPSNPSSSLKCDQLLTLYNSGRGFFIRLDGGPGGADDKPPAPPTRPDLKCPLNIARAIDARFKTVKIGGISSVALVFNVPADLQNNTGLDISVAKVKATIPRSLKRVTINRKKRVVSILSSVKCKGSKRVIGVQFLDRSNSSVAAQSSTKC